MSDTRALLAAIGLTLICAGLLWWAYLSIPEQQEEDE